jgi:cysteine-rich repeat protein
MRSTTSLRLAAILGSLVALSGAAHAASAPDATSVLILSPTVTGAASSNEATRAVALGFTPVVVDGATWGAMTAAEFHSYRALVLGDATCAGLSVVAAAEANRTVWSAVVDGNIAINGTDPVYHSGQGGLQMTESFIAFAANEPSKTGLYVSLSCYYHETGPSTPVPLLDQFGSFTVTGVGCYNDAHIVALHPALAGMTDASLSNWSCSVHEAFDSFPDDFLPLVIAEGVSQGAISFPDGSSGPPYCLARGADLTPVECGNDELQIGEECDDGNVVNGDGCSAQCNVEECGNERVDFGEECDDGNTESGDGCSATCQEEGEAVCGDGSVNQESEECDDGNAVSGDGCSATCLAEVCGNERLDAGEECDDGNVADGDGCSAGCEIEECGDGVVQPGLDETCDDGNTANGDGCSAACQDEDPCVAACAAPGALHVSAANTWLIGTSGDDVLCGDDRDNVLRGNGGSDMMCGFGGADNLYGHLGGADYMSGGEGHDILRAEGGDDTVLGGAGDDSLFGHGGDDVIDGGDGNDTIRAGAGNDTVDGGADTDIVNGEGGVDACSNGEILSNCP